MSKILNGLPEEKLTPSEEAFLSNEACESAWNRLTLHNMREAVPYATKCCRAALEESEVYSLCYTALMKAARNFRPMGVRFFAYAKVYLRGELSRTWRTKDVVRSSSMHETGPEPSGTRRHSPSPNSDDAEDGETASCEDGAPLEPDFVEPEYAALDLKEKWAVISPLIQVVLNERERTVIKLYYESGFPFEEIGIMLVPSVSRAAVQSTHCRALKKIRAALTRSKQREM